jgi:hypothetical protein
MQNRGFLPSSFLFTLFLSGNLECTHHEQQFKQFKKLNNLEIKVGVKFETFFSSK